MTPTFAEYALEGAVRVAGRSCLIVFLVCGLVNFPAAAANEKPLGSIIQADKALLGNADAMIGATVYPGDALATSTGGTVRLKLGAGQLYLLGGSAATLLEQPSAVRAKVGGRWDSRARRRIRWSWKRQKESCGEQRGRRTGR